MANAMMLRGGAPQQRLNADVQRAQQGPAMAYRPPASNVGVNVGHSSPARSQMLTPQMRTTPQFQPGSGQRMPQPEPGMDMSPDAGMPLDPGMDMPQDPGTALVPLPSEQPAFPDGMPPPMPMPQPGPGGQVIPDPQPMPGGANVMDPGVDPMTMAYQQQQVAPGQGGQPLVASNNNTMKYVGLGLGLLAFAGAGYYFWTKQQEEE